MSILDHPPNEDLLERREDVNLDVELIAGKPHERIIPLSLSAIGLAVLAACGGGTNEGTSTVTIPENSAPASSIPSTPNSTANSTPSGAPTQPTNPTGSSGTPTTSNGTPTQTTPTETPVTTTSLSANSDEQAARFLQQAQFSSVDVEINDVRSGTYAQWLQRQFDAPSGITGWDWLEQRGYGVNDKNQYVFNLALADFMMWNQLFTAPDQMRKRVSLALSEFFVASLQSAEFDWRSYAYAAWWDMLNRNAFGNYRQLLQDVTLMPAMGYYLNTRGNQKENTATGRVPDENYAREVMQLFSIGLYQLNPDGTEKLDANGQKIDVYTQSDVTNLARVFTGYDFDKTVGFFNPRKADDSGFETYTQLNKDFARRPMVLDPTKHSTLAATFLGTTVAAGTPGATALTTALDALFNHPNTAPFFCRQMIQRLVTSNPSPNYVARVAAKFINNGSGVRGDLKAVWTAILLDPENRALEASSTAGFGKLREPIVRLVQWGRSFGFGSASGGWKMFETSNPATQLGQSPLRSPSVFNFFRPGFVPPGTALATTKATAPEFQLVNETSVGGYLNYMQNIQEAGVYVASPAGAPNPFTGPYVQDITAKFTQELTVASDAVALVNRLNLIMCAGRLSTGTITLMVNALNATPLTPSSNTNDKLNRVRGAVLMVLACSEYLIQK
jgi:uncharacterized protein (DUF1800 family)